MTSGAIDEASTEQRELIKTAQHPQFMPSSQRTKNQIDHWISKISLIDISLVLSQKNHVLFRESSACGLVARNRFHG